MEKTWPYVDVLLFTGLGSYSHGVRRLQTNQHTKLEVELLVLTESSLYLRDEFDFDVEVVDFMFSWRYEELVQIVDSRVVAQIPN